MHYLLVDRENGYQDGDDGEEEVMPLDLSSSEASLSSTDQLDDERDLSVKAWGRNVAAYYKEGEEAREEEESLDGELEEREALQLQTAQATLLSQSDFDAQFPSGVGMDQSPLSDVSMQGHSDSVIIMLPVA